MEILPTLGGVAIWGVGTGIAMAELMGTGLALAMTLLVFGGSSQLAALPLIATGMPIWSILLAATLVNLRFVIFSAALNLHFGQLSLGKKLWFGYLNGDVNFALLMRRYPAHRYRPQPPPSMVSWYYLGLSACNWLVWQSASVLGIFLAGKLPSDWDISFIGTLALLAITLQLLNDRRIIMATLAGVGAAMLTVTLPHRLDILAAVVAAVVFGQLWDYCAARYRSGGTS